MSDCFFAQNQLQGCYSTFQNKTSGPYESRINQKNIKVLF